LRRAIIIVEDFYDDPDEIVRYARTLSYVAPYNSEVEDIEDSYVAWRASRFRPAAKCPFKSSKVLIERLATVVGERIDLEHWNRDFPVDERGYPAAGYKEVPRSAWWNCTFHSKHHPFQQLGEGVHSHTGRDTWNASGDDGWAGILYLNKQADLQTGLRTWDNIRSEHRFDWMTPKENWILRDTIANVYNRLVIHRGDIPHSGSAGWGRALAEGRFYQTFFFRTKGPHREASIPTSALGLKTILNL
jgi:hypothetical protein